MRAFLLSAFLCPLVGLSQVGIGTTTPNASAKLEVNSSNQGFLPPRVALSGTDDATQPAGTRAIASPATGLLVYNTATAGTGINAVTPGFYYYDGSKWQRIINTQPDATVTFNTANPNSGSPTFTGGPGASTNYVYVSEIDNSQWTYNGSTYSTYTPPATTPSTPWYLSGGTTDAGSNKTSAVYRTGRVGIGTGTSSPANILEVRGTGGTGTGLRLPTGAATGRVLTSNANGDATWQTSAGTLYTEVHANLNTSGNYSSGTAINEFSLTTADNVKTLYGASYGFIDGTGTGASSDRWVAPYTGKFRVTTTIFFNNNASYTTQGVYAYMNNSSPVNILTAKNAAADITLTTSTIVSLSQNDYINWQAAVNGASIWRGAYHTFFRIESVE